MKINNRKTLSIIAATLIPLALSSPALALGPGHGHGHDDKSHEMPDAKKSAPTMDKQAKKIWDKSVNATMGKEAKNYGIKSMRLSGTMSMPSQGINANMNILIATDKGVRMVMEIPGLGSFEQGLSGDVAWSSNMMEGPKILEGEEAKQYHKQSDLYAHLHWDQYYQSITFKGQETVTMPDDTEVMTNALELLSIDDDTISTHYYNADSGLLVKSVTDVTIAGGAKIPSTAYTMDYRDVGGIKIPFKTISSTGPMQQIIEFTSVEVNVEIGEDELALPKDIQELLED
ncbi:MAG: hypothetical protein JKY43_09410 [Phycisphaerales bacterium]|nr:hypothetical protein [Phycisphaerales bacterium]